MSIERLEPMTGCGILGILKCLAGVPGVLPLIHGPVSCSSGHRLAMLYANVEPLLPTTAMVERDMALGARDKLREALAEAWKQYHPGLLAVILTCATSLVEEEYESILLDYERQTGAAAVLLDGSGLAGDETDAPDAVYDALCRKLKIMPASSGGLLVLEGLPLTDYNRADNSQILWKLIETGLGCRVTPGLFSGISLPELSADYRAADKVFAGLLWRRSELDSAAPFGVEGSRRFLEWVARQTGRHGLTPQGVDTYDRAVKELEPFAQKLRSHSISVAIEAAGWYGYGLADFLTNELGCRVLLCVDRAHPKKPERPVCEEFYEDVGRWELVELMKAFGARLVFGSSNVRSDDNWDYIPFFAPVWRTEEPIGALLGYEGALTIANRLLKLAEGAP
ncbi:nitrogenase component 1 [Anaerotruncus colihominis]|uniref:nitrogenase component 1 n=1 Tax=Anaerotruncus colihominis TaxID=169435 RepID=UPI00351805B3